ncbi:cupin domain-containing protein [Thalassotalea atypica]|uniref:cupin domain-containing protein n=1 Tax=Thalassotalea atypica TaxID=2054316 RepID=UPI0025732E63|nr:cupin domain-containing protein [Thalassotalea atypica]
MYELNWGDLTPELFLKEYWQKKPLIIKNGFKQFADPIAADELAGLAMEEEIESRIIAHQNFSDWQVSHGPFEDFSDLKEQGWTLLVQAVNNWSDKTNDLLRPFKFVPNWRIDDVMVSFSTPEGGVGAHLDQYDVFIIQGSGKRRWQVGLPDSSLEQLVPHPDLKQVSSFAPVIDVITEPGDIVYIPPNHPHNGVALENSLNYSIGFQAPSGQELVSAFADTLIDQNIGCERFGDAGRKIAKQPELLTSGDLASLKRFMLSHLNDDELFSHMVSTFTTSSHHALEILMPVEKFTEETVTDFLNTDGILVRPVLGLKSLINQQNNCLYINGDQIVLDSDTKALGLLLAQNATMTTEKLKSFSDCLKNVQMLTTVLNMGYWYID